MKVNSGQRLGVVVPKLGDAKSSSIKNGAAQKSDRVDISGSSGEVGMLKAMLPNIGTDKVPALRQLVDSGTYHVESKAVAEKMLEHWKDFQLQ